jgi:hypothetical protein
VLPDHPSDPGEHDEEADHEQRDPEDGVEEVIEEPARDDVQARQSEWVDGLYEVHRSHTGLRGDVLRSLPKLKRAVESVVW